MQDIIDMELEEYIPLKIIFNKDKEAVEYISYSKDKTSSLEFTVGIKSGLLKRITLLLCKEYSETMDKLVVEKFEDGKIIFHSDDIECPVFKTILYSNGSRIILSDKKSSHYIKMDKVYFGLSETDDIIEICVCDMRVSELEHLKKRIRVAVSDAMAASSYMEKSMTEATNSPQAGFVVGSLTGMATYGTLGEAELEVVNNVKRPQQLGNVGEGGSDTVAYHSVGGDNAAKKIQSVLDGIDISYTSPESRFGQGFYVAADGNTTVAELAYHGTDATYSIRYDMNLNGQKVLDLTDTNIAKQWNYSQGKSSILECHSIAETALDEGYTVIKVQSYRDNGINYIIYDNFDEILQPQMVTPIGAY